MNKIAIFDLDFTLINVNSTTDFIMYFLKKKSLKRWFKLFAFKILDDIRVLKFIPNSDEFMRNLYIKQLEGFSKKELDDVAQIYWEKRAQKFINAEIYQKLQNFKTQNISPILISATLDPVAELIAKKLEFSAVFSSKMNYDESGICKGIFDNDLLGNKHLNLTKIEEKIGKIDRENSYCISDNKTDTELLKCIKNSCAVCYNSLDKIFWDEHKIQTTFIKPATGLNNNYFFLPLFYFYYTRVKQGIWGHFWNIFLFPLFSLVFFEGQITLKIFFVFLLTWVCYRSFYEIGYILNDCVATRKELSPNFRISVEIFDNYKKYIISRVVYSFTLLFILSFFVNKMMIFRFIFFILIFAILFTLHNNLSKKRRLFVFPLLHTSNYIMPIIVFPEVNIVAVTIAAFLFSDMEFLLNGMFLAKVIFKDTVSKNRVRKLIFFYKMMLLAILFTIFIVVKTKAILYLLIGGAILSTFDLFYIIKESLLYLNAKRNQII